MIVEQYEVLATGRTGSMFAGDRQRAEPRLRNALAGSSVAVIGAAGSIGRAVVSELAGYKLSRLILIDIDENNLVEVVRDLRSRSNVEPPAELLSLPIGLGSFELRRFF